MNQNPFDCDEHVCSVTEWSCGDGQCIDEINRYRWQENITVSNTQCHSMREYMYMCELSVRYRLWTSINGTCYDSTNVIYYTFSDQKWNESNQTKNEYCTYLIKCALSGGLEQHCPCGTQSCNRLIEQHCPQVIQYPSKGLLAPYLIANYNNKQNWSQGIQPNFYTMSGGIRCHGYYAQTFMNKSIRLRNDIRKRHIELSNAFCEDVNILNNTNRFQFHSTCYANVSHTMGQNFSSAFLDICKRCISQYRINDGT